MTVTKNGLESHILDYAALSLRPHLFFLTFFCLFINHFVSHPMLSFSFFPPPGGVTTSSLCITLEIFIKRLQRLRDELLFSGARIKCGHFWGTFPLFFSFFLPISISPIFLKRCITKLILHNRPLIWTTGLKLSSNYKLRRQTTSAWGHHYKYKTRALVLPPSISHFFLTFFLVHR